jgi:hypothetical protein
MTGTDERPRLDGNAIAGLLQEAFGFDPSSARTVCASCGAEDHLGALIAYTTAPGAVLRCRGCEGVQLRVATDGRGRMWLDLTGVRCLELSLEGGSGPDRAPVR